MLHISLKFDQHFCIFFTGVDEQGHVANYVETEQCLLFGNHILSFAQIRGSVPIYWSQPGFKYRPPPRIDRGTYSTPLFKFLFISNG